MRVSACGGRRCGAMLGLLLALFAGVVGARPPAPDPQADAKLGEVLAVSVLTFAPGDIYWQRFGHNALRVRNTVNGRSLVYNYGVFDFRQQDFLLNFARGRMRYRLQRDSFDAMLDLYRQEKRWTVEQDLQLTAAQRGALARFLEWNAAPENAEYRYDYFIDNCSTRVRDALDRVLGGQLQVMLEAAPTNASYRFDATRLMSPDPLLMLGIDFALGPSTDHKLNRWQRSFVPMELMAALREVWVTDESGQRLPLVSQEQRLIDSQRPQPPARPPAHIAIFAVLGLLLAGLLWLRGRPGAGAGMRRLFVFITLLLALSCGLAGLVLAAFWGLTEHHAAWKNVNLLFANPLCLLMIPIWWRSRKADWSCSTIGKGLAFAVGGFAVLGGIPAWLTGAGAGPLAWGLLLCPAHVIAAWVCFHSQGAAEPAATVNRAQGAAL